MLGFVELAELVNKQQKALGERDRQSKDRIAGFLEFIGGTLEKAVLAYRTNDAHSFHQACENLWFYIWIGRNLIREEVLPPLSILLEDRLIEAGRDWDEIGAPTGASDPGQRIDAALNRLSRASGLLLGAAQYVRARPESVLDRVKILFRRVRARLWRDAAEISKKRDDWPYRRSDGSAPGYSLPGEKTDHFWSGAAHQYVERPSPGHSDYVSD